MNQRKKRKGPSEARCYDVAMIRDFLDHLLWELRISHHESQTSKINPELAEQLEKYQKKRQTVGLLFATGIDGNPDPDKYRQFQTLRGEVRKSQLLCLEALQSLFREALESAAKPKTFNILRFKAIEDAMTFNILRFKTIEDAISAFQRRKREHETGER